MVASLYAAVRLKNAKYGIVIEDSVNEHSVGYLIKHKHTHTHTQQLTQCMLI